LQTCAEDVKLDSAAMMKHAARLMLSRLNLRSKASREMKRCLHEHAAEVLSTRNCFSARTLQRKGDTSQVSWRNTAQSVLSRFSSPLMVLVDIRMLVRNASSGCELCSRTNVA